MIRIIFFMIMALNAIDASAWLTEPPEEVKELAAPYLMTDNHPIKSVLDRILSSSRATMDIKSLKRAGFQDIDLRKRGITFARHPDMPGYVFKLICDYSLHSWNHYENSFRKQDEYLEWIGRIRKRNEIASLIKHYQIDSMITPRKWLYAIPTSQEPKQKTSMIKKFYILVADDLDIFSIFETIDHWKTLPTEDLLRDYYLIIRDAKLCDLGPPNQSFTKSGKLAFIDTKEWPERLFNIMAPTRFLNNEMADFWKELVENN